MRGILCVAAAAIVFAAPAKAEQRHQFNLPAGSLGQAIVAMGQQANVSIGVGDPSLARVRVRPLRGSFTAEQALRRLLVGTPARVVSVGESSFRILRAPARRRRERPLRAPSLESLPTVEPDEIIVTASKRSTPLRDYAGPAVVIGSGDFGAASAAEGTAAILARAASLGSTHLGTGRNKLFVRAIADSSFNGATQSTVGQYFGEARLNYNGPDPDLRLYDIASIELLPGPQGTLYGAGSMAGILRIVPNAPDPSASSGASIGSGSVTQHGKMGVEFANIANAPLGGASAVRLVGYGIREGGYIDNPRLRVEDVNRVDIAGGRAALLTSLSPEWTVEGGVALQSIRGQDSQYAVRGREPLTRRSPVRQPFSSKYTLAHATVRGGWGAYRLTTAVSSVGQMLSEDFDAAVERPEPKLFRQRNRLRMIAAEGRLSHEQANGDGWTAGVSLIHNRTRLHRSEGPPALLAPRPGVTNRHIEGTAFFELIRSFSEAISVTGGARLSHVRFEGISNGPSLVGPGGGGKVEGSEWELLPSLALGFKPRADATFYLRYQESFRPGGAIVQTNATQKIDSDSIAAWEAGIRVGQQNAPLSGAVAMSYSRWRDIQSDLIDLTGFPSTINLGDGHIVSAEGRLSWRFAPAVRLGLEGVLNRSRVSNPNPGIIFIDDVPLPSVPDVTATASIDFAQPLGRVGDLQVSGRTRYVGESTLGIGPTLGRKQGGYFDTALDARVIRGRWDYFVSATNLLDAVGNRFAFGSALTLDRDHQITPLRPRTLRLGAVRRF